MKTQAKDGVRVLPAALQQCDGTCAERAGVLQEHNATIYVAGNAKSMPAAVRRSFVDAVAEGGQLSPEDAVRFH